MSSPNLSRGGPSPKVLNGFTAGTVSEADTRTRGVTTVIHQSQPSLPLSKLLKDGDIVLLLTPGVAPDPSSARNGAPGAVMDPFEPLGKALARHHPWIRHVPYLPRNGITGTHVVHIRLAAAVVFVISGPPRHGQPSQVAMAEITRSICDHRPQIVVACCDLRELGLLDAIFPTIIQIPNYSPPELEVAADVLFGEVKKPSTGPNVQNLILSPKSWYCEEWRNELDLPAVYDLWCQCFPKRFHTSRLLLQTLLCRDGYAKHWVVREPETSEVVGFCATYTSYANSDNEQLIGSVAAVIVRPSYRQRGVGLSLHTHALRQLSKIRGVSRLQLGSAFPRLLYGLPVDSPWEDWFRRRSWPIHPQSSEPGMGQEACDWFLRFEDWPATGPMPPGLTFRPCEFHEFDMVLGMVSRESRQKGNMGWYDQYAKLGDSMNIRDIILGLEGEVIVAIALTYSKNNGSPVADDLPWAGTIADDVGGVTCICITDKRPNMAIPGSTIMIRLLDSCIRTLASYGMRSLFIDAVKGGDQGFKELGFQKWAAYREVWRDT
ncbi:hypothetical protein QBC34DRAFT_447338 [Podospora aff. communis PSN243]|uniref:N-acetyltransferase domain-containing protein n=1 Tax=Podospora aff. communis PSN243 TaxID=3040156 RepID=A0AAV9GZ68_9PEZI|nr:hypothetical protein QBC34DRAFT_447338 [Podospora aff. communis PSN243]